MSHHEERQQALLELLHTRALDRCNEHRLLSLSNAAGFYQVSELLYRRQRQFGHILQCYCSDRARQNLVFAYIKQTIASPNISVEEKKRILEAVLEHLESLICIDAKKTTELVTGRLGISLVDAVSQVIRCQNEDATFAFLHCLFETAADEPDGRLPNDDWQLDPSVYERYAELLCQRSMVTDVVAFLRLFDGYRLTKMLEICQRFRILEAVIVLLEKSGDVTGAFEVALQTLRTRLSVVVGFDDDVFHQTQTEQLRTVQVAVESCISLLNRNAIRLEQLQLRHLWFTLFDLLIDNYYRLFGCKVDSSKVGGNCCQSRLSSEFSEVSSANKYQTVLQHTVSCMVSHIPFTAVLEHIVTLEDGTISCFGNLRDLLLSIMDACRYQQTLYTTCTRIVHNDVNSALGRLAISARSPISLNFSICLACRQSLNEDRSSEVQVVCFQCGHAFHNLCLEDSVSVGKVGEKSNTLVGKRWQCLVCCGLSRPRLSTPFSRSRVVGVTEHEPSEQEVDSTTSQPLILSPDVESLKQLRSSQRTASLFEVLSELRQLDEVKTVRSSSVWKDVKNMLGNGSAFHGESFSLKLAPPPAQ